MTSTTPKLWADWLALAEWWFNTNFHSSLKMSPFQALYGYVPPHLAFHIHSTTSVASVQEYLKKRDHMLQLLKEDLLRAQDRMKFYADNSRSDRSFIVGDWKIGTVAYKLKLPIGSRIHPVVHVSQLKKKIGQHTIPSSSLPLVDTSGAFTVTPVAVLKHREILRGGSTVKQVLIQWTNSQPEYATWEDISHIKAQFPEFILEDKDA
ncbi:uncharacterized protein LOC113324903 [Papaver somniferum]|uniref:uncharacterized protein LOC113324903 n=1 Tax=Papaver somniferum TaxID=3469 RepID=UPI000E6FAA0B|nr:uncharacterized protein LOC113324903 [Papaver somniferum]